VIARLVIADLRDSLVLWAAAVVVAATAALAVTVPGTLIASALPVAGVTSLALLGIAGTVIVFTLVAVVVVVVSVTRATVDARRPTFGLWQVSGVLPRQVGVIVFWQIAIVGVAGAIAGAALGLAVAPPFVQATLADSLDGLDARAGLPVAAAAVVLTFATVCLSALPAARDAAATPPIRLLTGAGDADAGAQGRRSRGRRIGVILLAAAGALLLVQLYVSLPGSIPTGGSPALLIGPVVVALACLPGGRAMAALVDGWTALVPARWSTAFLLARASVAHGREGAAPIVPFVVAIGLPVGFLAGLHVAQSASGTGGGTSTGGTALVLSGPVVLAAVGGAAALLLRAALRRREAATLDAVGAGAANVIAQRLWEAVIVVATAALVAGGSAVIAAVVAWVVLVGAYPATALPFDPGPFLVVSGLCLALCLLVAGATVPAALRAQPRG
jgi:putative ABC transport system permease protein